MHNKQNKTKIFRGFCHPTLGCQQDNHLFYTNHPSLWLPKLTLIGPSIVCWPNALIWEGI